MALEPGQPDNYIEIETNNGTSQKLYRHFDRSDDIVDFIFKKSDYTNTIITVQVNGLPNNVTLYLVDENSNQLYSPVDINGNWVTTRCSVTVGKYSAIQLPAQFTSDLSSYTDFPAGMYNWKLKFLGDSNYLEKEIPLNVEIRDFEILEVLTPQIYPNEDVQVKLRTYGDTIYPYLISDWASESSRFYYDLSYILTANATYDNSTGIITYPNSDIDATIGGKNFVINKEKHFTINYEVISPIIACTGDTMGKDNKTSFLYDEKIYFGLRTDKERTGGFCDEASVSPEPTVPEITEPTIEDPDVELFAEKYSYDIEIGLQGVSITPGPMSDRQYYLPKNLYTNDSCPNFYSLPEGFISTENKLPPGTYYLEFNNVHTRFCKGSYNSKKQFTISTQNCELELIDENGLNLKSRYLYNGSTPIPNAKLGLVKDGSLIKTGTTDSNGEVSWNVDSSGNYFSLSFDYDDSYLLFSQNVDFTLTVVSDIIIQSNKNTLSYLNNDILTLNVKPVDSSGNTINNIDVVFKKGDEILTIATTGTSGIAQYQYMSTGEGDTTFTVEAVSKSKTYNIEDVFYYKTEEEIIKEWTKYTLPNDRYIYKNPLMLNPDDNFTLEYRYNTIGRAVDGVDLYSANDYTIKLGNVWDRYNDRLQAYCSSSSSSRNKYYGYTPGFNTSSIYKIKLLDNKATWYDNDTIYETNRAIEPTLTPHLRHDIFMSNSGHLDYIKVKTDYEKFYDSFTYESGYWEIPDNVKAGSQYSSDGWSIHSSSGYQQIKNKIIIPSENVEVSFTYIDGYSPSGIANIIVLFYGEENYNKQVGLTHSGGSFEFYPGIGKTNYTLKSGDKVVFKYNNGKSDIIVNNTLISTYTYTDRSIAGSHLELHTHQDRGVILKDFRIKFRSESKDVYYYDAFTSNSGNWTIPSTTQSASTYTSDGWEIRTSNSSYDRISLNKTISSDNFEVQYTFMGGATGNTTRQMIEFLRSNSPVLGIRYAPSTQLFEIYNAGDAFYTAIGPVDVQIGDVVLYKYNQGNITIEINNNIIGICYHNVSIVGSTPILVTRYDKWWRVKDFSIKMGRGG